MEKKLEGVKREYLSHVRIMKDLFDTGKWFKMSKNDINVYMALCSFYNWKKGFSFPTIEKVSAAARVPRVSVIRSIKHIASPELALITVEKTRNSMGHNINRYFIIHYLVASSIKDPCIKMILGGIFNANPSIKNAFPSIMLSTSEYKSQVSSVCSKNTHNNNTSFNNTKKIYKDEIFKGMNEKQKDALREGNYTTLEEISI